MHSGPSIATPAQAPRHKAASSAGDVSKDARGQAMDKQQDERAPTSDYRGFVAGIASGAAKLGVGHPFDTVKVRLQTTGAERFRGGLECLAQTVRVEGVAGLYKGATPPLVGWMVMDSVMLGSLAVFRRLVGQRVFGVERWRAGEGDGGEGMGFGALMGGPMMGGLLSREGLVHGGYCRLVHNGQAGHGEVGGGGHGRVLPPLGHGIAGLAAGFTVSLIAAPVEHIKARLQVQYAADKSRRLFHGPLDCLVRIYRAHGLSGIYRGLGATLIFRSGFFWWWASYDVLSRALRHDSRLAQPAVDFWAGGLSAQVFWLTSYPADLVKQRIMTDALGGAIGDGQRRYYRWMQAARAVYREAGWRGYWRGFVPCILRAFPANAVALLAFEATMRALP